MYRWTALVFVFLLAGCSNTSTLPAQPRHAIGGIGALGGAFTASYSGTQTNGKICATGYTVTWSGSFHRPHPIHDNNPRER